jgi:hypothetical protein
VKLHNRMAIGFGGLLLAAAASTSVPAGAAAQRLPAANPSPGAMNPGGSGHAVVARSVNVRAAAAAAQIAPHFRHFGPLGRDGQVAGSALPRSTTTGVRPQPASSPTVPGGPNTGQAQKAAASHALKAAASHAAWQVAVPHSPPTKINANFHGMTQGSSNCGTCQPPDPSAAVSSTQIAHTVNLRLQVYSKAGTLLCGVGLNTLARTSASLSDPRIQWDNVYKRFSMVFIPVPASDSATPTEYLLTSQTSNACGSWWVYTVTFSGSLYPAGALLDYPYLGQDNVPSGSYPAGGSLLSSTNNFCCRSSNFHTYLNSTVFAIPKYPAYHGQGFNFPAFSVAFSTAPVSVSGLGKTVSSTTYWLASVPGFGYDLYAMTHSSQPGTTLALQASISSAFNAPSRRVIQPGTSQTLDPLDGRIVWAPVVAGSFIWFTHGIDLAGFPAVRYGAVGVISHIATVAVAYHSNTSDDFNPSLSVTPAGSNTIYAWLNWAYTDSQVGIATSDTVNGVRPGAGVPNEIATDRTLIHGSPTSTNFRFGDFSSVEIDPSAASSTCPAGRTAVLSQQYFSSSGKWQTRIARTSFC